MAASQFLTELEVQSRRYEKMMRAFCEKRGLKYEGDPAQPIIDAVRANDACADKNMGRLTSAAGGRTPEEKRAGLSD